MLLIWISLKLRHLVELICCMLMLSVSFNQLCLVKIKADELYFPVTDYAGMYRNGILNSWELKLYGTPMSQKQLKQRMRYLLIFWFF